MAPSIKFIVVALLVGILGCWLSAPVLAHVVENDDPIRATLHVSPDDYPVMDQPSQLLFEFKDTEKKFSVADCDCTAKILKGDREIYAGPLFRNNAEPSPVHASFSFTFPEATTYQVQVVGASRKPDAFTPFTLTYNVRVASEATAFPRLGAHLLHLIAGGVLGGIVIGLIIVNRFKEGAKQSSVGE